MIWKLFNKLNVRRYNLNLVCSSQQKGLRGFLIIEFKNNWNSNLKIIEVKIIIIRIKMMIIIKTMITIKTLLIIETIIIIIMIIKMMITTIITILVVEIVELIIIINTVKAITV